MSIDLFKPYVDFVFKGVFKKSPKSLASLISSIQNWPEDRIKSITYLDGQLSKDHLEGKAGAVDLIIELDNKDKIHVEVQVLYHEAYPERSIYYWAKLYGQQLYRGESYTELKPLVCIHILVFNLFDDNKALRSFQLRDDHSSALLSNHVKIIFLEINKVFSDNSLNDNVIHWINFIRNPNEEREMLENKDSFKEAYEELEKLSKDPDSRWAYELAFKSIKDEESRVKDIKSVAKAQGLAEGMAQGMAQGMARGLLEGVAEGKLQAQTEFIYKMHKNGLTIQEISKILSVDAQDISDLLKIK